MFLMGPRTKVGETTKSLDNGVRAVQESRSKPFLEAAAVRDTNLCILGGGPWHLDYHSEPQNPAILQG